MKRENNLATAVNELMQNYSEIESDFLMFFPEVMSYVKTLHN
ncbi:ACP phosphodiesterase [Hydrocoleum sp. CS-953]